MGQPMSLVSLLYGGRSSPRKCSSPNKRNTHTRKHQPWERRTFWHLAATAWSDLRDGKWTADLRDRSQDGKWTAARHERASTVWSNEVPAGVKVTEVENRMMGTSTRWHQFWKVGRFWRLRSTINTVNTLNMTDPYMVQMTKVARHGSVHPWSPHLKGKSQRIKGLSVCFGESSKPT